MVIPMPRLPDRTALLPDLRGQAQTAENRQPAQQGTWDSSGASAVRNDTGSSE